MLHAKFQVQMSFYSGGECFKRFTIYGHGGHLVHLTKPIFTMFRPLFPRRLNMKFAFDWPSGFRGGHLKMRDGRQTTDEGQSMGNFKLTLKHAVCFSTRYTYSCIISMLCMRLSLTRSPKCIVIKKVVLCSLLFLE